MVDCQSCDGSPTWPSGLDRSQEFRSCCDGPNGGPSVLWRTTKLAISVIQNMTFLKDSATDQVVDRQSYDGPPSWPSVSSRTWIPEGLSDGPNDGPPILLWTTKLAVSFYPESDLPRSASTGQLVNRQPCDGPPSSPSLWTRILWFRILNPFSWEHINTKY